MDNNTTGVLVMLIMIGIPAFVVGAVSITQQIVDYKKANKR